MPCVVYMLSRYRGNGNIRHEISIRGLIRLCTRGEKTPSILQHHSQRKGTTLEEDQAELELVGEIWCRLGKERMRRGEKRKAEECCGYVTELLPQVNQPFLKREVIANNLRCYHHVNEGVQCSLHSREPEEGPQIDQPLLTVHLPRERLIDGGCTRDSGDGSRWRKGCGVMQSPL